MIPFIFVIFAVLMSELKAMHKLNPRLRLNNEWIFLLVVTYLVKCKRHFNMEQENGRQDKLYQFELMTLISSVLLILRERKLFHHTLMVIILMQH